MLSKATEKLVRVAMGDVIIIIGYAYMDFEEAKSFKPCLVFPNEETNLID